MPTSLTSLSLIALIVALLPSTMTNPVSDGRAPATAQGSWGSANEVAEFTEQLDYQLQFRSQFDFLTVEMAEILRVMEEGRDNGSYESWGLHLADDELAELDRRDGIEFARLPVDQAVRATGLSEEDAYRLQLSNSDWMGLSDGGTFIDQKDGGVIKVAIKEGPEFGDAEARAKAVISKLIQEGGVRPSDFAIVPVEFSLAELTDTADAFFDGPHRKLGSGVAYYPSLAENTLVMEAEPKAINAVLEFAEGYPSGMVTVIPVEPGATDFGEIAAPASNHSHPHAGVKIDIYSAGTSSGQACTWGFTARTSYPYAIVAGHCLPGHSPTTYHGAMNPADVVAAGQLVTTSGFTYGYNGERGEVGRVILESSVVDDHNCYHADADCATSILTT